MRGLQLRSEVTPAGQLEMSLAEVVTRAPAADEVIVRVEATPINPSDLITLVGAADPSTARSAGTLASPVVAMDVPDWGMAAMASRVGQSLPVGSEGAGTVVAAGSSDAVQRLIGATVAAQGGAMFSEYQTVNVAQVMELPPGTKPAQGASCFVNPLTALTMVETMRAEGHSALVHTAAASNLGQMLNKICIADGIPLVNVVRRSEQEALLRDLGAVHVVNSTSGYFMEELVAAVQATGATLGFDAVGGGPLAGQILTAMEAAGAVETSYNPYGAGPRKRVYIYGRLDFTETVLPLSVGMNWDTGAWVVTSFLHLLGKDGQAALRARVLAELDTTFASTYAAELSLTDALHPETIARYAAKATGSKFLICPNPSS